MTTEEKELMLNLLRKVQYSDLFVFDTSLLSTCIDAESAAYLVWLSKFAIQIYEAIVDLYTFDVTGCIDSEL